MAVLHRKRTPSSSSFLVKRTSSDHHLFSGNRPHVQEALRQTFGTRDLFDKTMDMYSGTDCMFGGKTDSAEKIDSRYAVQPKVTSRNPGLKPVTKCLTERYSSSQTIAATVARTKTLRCGSRKSTFAALSGMRTPAMFLEKIWGVGRVR